MRVRAVDRVVMEENCNERVRAVERVVMEQNSNESVGGDRGKW